MYLMKFEKAYDLCCTVNLNQHVKVVICSLPKYNGHYEKINVLQMIKDTCESFYYNNFILI